MASFNSLFLFLFFLVLIIIIFNSEALKQEEEAMSMPILDSAEQESVYRVLDSVNPTIPWRSMYPDDLCSSAPHGIVCDYFSDSDSGNSFPDSVHVTELSFGFVSDNSPNPPCSPEMNSTLSPLVFSSFKFLRKLFFYKCFNGSDLVSLPSPMTVNFAETLEELVFIDNPSFVAPLNGVLGNFTALRRVVLTGNGVFGPVLDETVRSLVSLEELTLSRNKLSGEIPVSLSRLENLKILDLSHNGFRGKIVPEFSFSFSKLLKLDLSYNGFSGEIPERLMESLKSLEFLDLSFNGFVGGFENGIPRSLMSLASLKEVYLSGNKLGCSIPDTWQNLGGLVRIGFSDMGLVGEIPKSMGVYLKNLSYLGLEGNKLQGSVPVEFGRLGSLCEINLENNSLSGRVFFEEKLGFGVNLKLSGNPGLCVDQDLWALRNNGSLGFGQVKLCERVSVSKPKPVPLNQSETSSSDQLFSSMVVVFFSLLGCYFLLSLF